MDTKIDDLAAPASVSSAPEPPSYPVPAITSQSIGKGVWRVDQGGTTVIEFRDRIVLFELGVNVATAKAVIAHARTLAPGKPVTHLVVTHNHFDHTAGLRQAVAEGLTIVQRRGSEPQFRDMVAHLAPDFPDDLARSPKPLKFTPWTSICGSPTTRRRSTSTGCATTATWRTCWWATSPSERLLMEGDLVTAAFDWQHWPDGFRDVVEKYKLNVERISPVHAVGLEQGQSTLTRAQAEELLKGGTARAREHCAAEQKKGNYHPGCPIQSQVLLMRIASAAARPAGRGRSRLDGEGQSAPAAAPDLEGGWVRLDVDGSGSFQGLASRIPRAALTPAGRKAADDAAARAAKPRFDFARDPSKPRGAGEGYVVTDGGCTLPGGVEPNSAAFHIVQSRDQVLIVRENPGLPRTIHLDGRVHPHLSRWTPTAVGHSVGRYEGGALVVDTIGLTHGQRHRRRLADAGNRPDRALPPVGRRQAADDHLHLAGPEGVSQAAHLPDRGRADASGQLGVRVLVRLERSQPAAVDRAAGAEAMSCARAARALLC